MVTDRAIEEACSGWKESLASKFVLCDRALIARSLPQRGPFGLVSFTAKHHEHEIPEPQGKQAAARTTFIR